MGKSDVHIELDRVVGELDELHIPYVICGALAAFAHGHRRATTGIDLILTAEGRQKFRASTSGGRERLVPITALVSGGIPGDGTPHGVVFPDPEEASIEVAGKHYLTLAKLIELKLASGLSAPDRLQDHADVIALIRANGLGEPFADGLHAYVRPRYVELWGYAQRPPGPPE